MDKRRAYVIGFIVAVCAALLVYGFINADQFIAIAAQAMKG